MKYINFIGLCWAIFILLSCKNSFSSDEVAIYWIEDVSSISASEIPFCSIVDLMAIIRVENHSKDSILILKSSHHQGDCYFYGHSTYFRMIDNEKGKDSLMATSIEIVDDFGSPNFDTIIPNDYKYYSLDYRNLTEGMIFDTATHIRLSYAYTKLGESKVRSLDIMLHLNKLSNKLEMVQQSAE